MQYLSSRSAYGKFTVWDLARLFTPNTLKSLERDSKRLKVFENLTDEDMVVISSF